MRLRLLRATAIVLVTSFAPTAMPPPAQANPAAAVMGACAAQPELCAVVVAAGGAWVLWQNGPKFWCTFGQCVRAKPFLHGDRQSDDSGRQAETIRLVKEPKGCLDMEKRFRASGFKLRYVRYVRNHAPGTFYEIICIFGGDSREVARFNKYWR